MVKCQRIEGWGVFRWGKLIVAIQKHPGSTYLPFLAACLAFLLILHPFATVMESSQGVGEMEECNSSESGWTKYIASPMQGIDDDDDNNGSGEDEGSDNGGDDDGNGGTSDSEDSMASDASSGPVHLDTSHSNAHTYMGDLQQHKQEESEEEEDGDDTDDGEHVGGATNYNGRAHVEKKAQRKRH